MSNLQREISDLAAKLALENQVTEPLARKLIEIGSLLLFMAQGIDRELKARLVASSPVPRTNDAKETPTA